MKMIMIRSLLCTMAAIFWLTPAYAQDKDGIATTVTITAKAGHEDALVKAITDYHKWVAQFEGHFEYTWYEILTGPDTGKYAARSGNHSWSDFDAEYDWQKEANEVFGKNVAPHIESAQNMITEEMEDFSHWPENWDGYSHFNVQDWYVKNGRYGEFRKSLKQIVDTLKAGDFPGYWGFFDVSSGGYGGQIRLVSAYKGWSDMVDKNPTFFEVMSKNLGGEEEFNTFMRNWGDTYKAGRNWTVKRMPEASDYGN